MNEPDERKWMDKIIVWSWNYLEPPLVPPPTIKSIGYVRLELANGVKQSLAIAVIDKDIITNDCKTTFINGNELSFHIKHGAKIIYE